LVIRIIIPILTSPRKIMSMVIPMVVDLITDIRAAVGEVMEEDNTPTVIEEDNMVANKEGGDSIGKVVGKSKASGAMGDEVNTVAGHVSSVNGPITRRMDGRMIGKSLKSIVGGSLRSRDGRGMMNKIGNSQGNSGHNEDGSSSKKLGHNGHRLSQEGGQINSKGISQEGGQINSKDLGHRLDGHNRMHRDQICLRRDGFLALGLGMVNNNPSINSSSTRHNNNNNNNNSSSSTRHNNSSSSSTRSSSSSTTNQDRGGLTNNKISSSSLCPQQPNSRARLSIGPPGLGSRA